MCGVFLFVPDDVVPRHYFVLPGGRLGDAIVSLGDAKARLTVAARGCRRDLRPRGRQRGTTLGKSSAMEGDFITRILSRFSAASHCCLHCRVHPSFHPEHHNGLFCLGILVICCVMWIHVTYFQAAAFIREADAERHALQQVGRDGGGACVPACAIGIPARETDSMSTSEIHRRRARAFSFELV